MTSEITYKWIKAGKILAKNPQEKVVCPKCEQTDLQVRDIQNEKSSNEMERILFCPLCGAKSVLRLNRPVNS